MYVCTHTALMYMHTHTQTYFSFTCMLTLSYAYMSCKQPFPHRSHQFPRPQTHTLGPMDSTFHGQCHSSGCEVSARQGPCAVWTGHRSHERLRDKLPTGYPLRGPPHASFFPPLTSPAPPLCLLLGPGPTPVGEAPVPGQGGWGGLVLPIACGRGSSS